MTLHSKYLQNKEMQEELEKAAKEAERRQKCESLKKLEEGFKQNCREAAEHGRLIWQFKGNNEGVYMPSLIDLPVEEAMEAIDRLADQYEMYLDCGWCPKANRLVGTVYLSLDRYPYNKDYRYGLQEGIRGKRVIPYDLINYCKFYSDVRRKTYYGICHVPFDGWTNEFKNEIKRIWRESELGNPDNPIFAAIDRMVDQSWDGISKKIKIVGSFSDEELWAYAVHNDVMYDQPQRTIVIIDKN